jgi:N-acylglucosamine-6-phosphate 2-epimerase
MLIDALQSQLIVSCQAQKGEPLYGIDNAMAGMAKAAIMGGAGAIRTESINDIRAIRAITTLPLIGLIKDDSPEVYITPTIASVAMVIDAGADVVAIDATDRPRPESIQSLIRFCKGLNKLVLADCSTLEEAIMASVYGADLVATTLSGYTQNTKDKNPFEPDFELLEAMVKQLNIPVIAEGRITEPWHVKRCFNLGAHAVVVGSAITRPQIITRRFVEAITV